jgi:hypothetical protein
MTPINDGRFRKTLLHASRFIFAAKAKPHRLGRRHFEYEEMVASPYDTLVDNVRNNEPEMLNSV